MNKTALILSGGGMKSSFTAGVLLGLSKQKGSKWINPDICIAGSGSAGTAAYYLAQQYDSILNIRSNLLTTKQTVDPLRVNKIIDIDFIIDSVFKIQDSLDVSKVINSSTKFFIPALNTKHGTIDYLLQDGRYDLLESLRATKAMPIVYKYFPQIAVGKNYYCDSIGSSKGINHIQFAIELGATEILLINNRPNSKPPGIDEKVFRLRLHSIPKEIRNNYAKEIANRKEYITPNTISLQIINPEYELPGGSLNNSKHVVDTCIKEGKKTCLTICNS